MRKFLSRLRQWLLVLFFPLMMQGAEAQALPETLAAPLRNLKRRVVKARAKGEPTEGIRGEWSDLVNQYKAQKLEDVALKIARTEARIQELRDRTQAKNKAKWMAQAKARSRAELEQKLLEVDEEYGNPEEQLALLDEDKAEYTATLKDLEDELGGRPEKSFLDKKIVMIVFTFALTYCEGTLTYRALEKLKFSESYGILLFITFYALITTYLVHQAAYYRSRGIRKAYFKSLGGALALATAVVLLRSYSPDSAPYDWVLHLLNYIFIGGAVLMMSHIQIRRFYWKTQGALKECVRKIDAMLNKLSRYSQIREQVAHAHEDTIEARELDNWDAQTREKAEQEGLLTELLSERERLSQQVEGYRNYGLNSLS